MATTTDVIVLEYQLKLDSLEKGYNKLETEALEAANAGKKAMTSIETGAKKAGTATQQVTKNTSELNNKLKDLSSNLPFAQQAQQAQALASAILGTGEAAKKSATGFQILKVAVASVPIFLLVAAIAGLLAYFKRTDEGATRLAGVFAAFDATLDLITGSLVSFGEATFQAGKSFENFGQFIYEIAGNIGKYLLNRALAPIFLLKDGFDALSLAIQGKGVEAFKELQNGVLQFLTGFENLASKTDEFILKAQAAAQAAYEWEKRMDALQDKMREDSLVIAENDAAISKLIIASKNKTIQDEKALGFLDQATALEKENLKISLENENAKLALIKERNAQQRESVNQDKKALTDELKLEETTAKRKIQILSELRSINDNFAEEEIAQQLKIIQIQRESDNLNERAENRKAAKREEIFQNQVKLIAQEEILAENAAKAQYLNGVINAEKYEQDLYEIKLAGLEKQKELLITDSRDIVEVDKAILDLQLANLDKHNKERTALEKEAADKKKAADKKANDDFLAMVQARLEEEDELAKKREEAEKRHQENLKTIRAAGVDVAETLVSGFYNNSAKKRADELDAELNAQQLKSNSATATLQDRLDKELITQEQFNTQKAAIDKQLQEKEREIKRKQFQADKKAALINIAINTAAAAVKTLATLGIPAGILGAAVAVALGAAQAAVVAAQPEPKFKDGVIDINGPGTATSDSIRARLSKGESVMTAKETKEHRGVFEAIRAKKYGQYVKENHVVPELEKMHRAAISRRESKASQAQSYLKLIASNNTDTSAMERQLKKNNTVNVANLSELADKIARQNYYNSFR